MFKKCVFYFDDAVALAFLEHLKIKNFIFHRPKYANLKFSWEYNPLPYMITPS